MSSYTMQFENGVVLGSAFVVSIVPTITAHRSVGLDVAVTGDGDAPVIDLVEETCISVRWHATLQDGMTHYVGSSTRTIGEQTSMLTTSAAYVEASREDPEFQELVARNVKRLYAYHAELKAGSTYSMEDEPAPLAGAIPGITDLAPRVMSSEEIASKVEARRERLHGFLVDAGILGKFGVGPQDEEPAPTASRKARPAPAKINDFDRLEAMLRKHGVAFDHAALAMAKKPPFA